jgi:hypothetical protein
VYGIGTDNTGDQRLTVSNCVSKVDEEISQKADTIDANTMILFFDILSVGLFPSFKT